MVEQFNEYRQELLDDINLEASIANCTPDEWFFENFALEKLCAMGELIDPQIRPFKKRCSRNRQMGFDAYSFDESDKSVVLITNLYSTSITENLTRTDIDTYKARMLNFLDEAYNNQLDLYFDSTDELLKIGRDIGRRLKIDYVKLDNDDSIDKIKLYIVTNRPLSERVTSFKTDDWNGKQVELNIWSLNRFYDLYASGRDKEPIRIITSKYGLSEGIPCIKAKMSDNLDYDAYLAIVPGSFLHKIYYDHGSRLLEGNVRAFLSNRGKVNKGIRETIRNEPTKFFTYNNGIACTAHEIKLSDDGHYIMEMEDLQIINGGQTTASLTSAFLKDKLSLDNIFIPMKLTVVKNDDYDAMIQNISKYANSQNKVKDSDLFSNHAFHRKFEELSKKIQAPAHGDYVNNTFWYYERSRGKYEQEQFKLLKKSEKDAFLKKYPKKQVIKKEELSKYFTACKLLRPDMVSKGSEKCMSFYAEYIDDLFQKKPEAFNEQFYKECICYAIMYKTTDLIVQKAPWYQVGGYKLNIVPYTVSKLISLIPSNLSLDYELIWKKQELTVSMKYEIERIAQLTNRFIQDSGGVIVTEYCKKEDTWKKFKGVKYNLSSDFLNDLTSKEIVENKMRSNIKEEKLSNDVNIEIEIVKLGAPYWRKLIEEGSKRGILSPQELDLLNIPASLDGPRPKIATPKQAKFIWKIREKLDNAGILV